MKTKISSLIMLFPIVLVSCAPVFVQSNTPTSTPFLREYASEDCFLTIPFVPEITGMDEVISVWGEPQEKLSSGGDSEAWNYGLAGTPQVSFEKQILETVSFYLKECTLEEIVAKLGPPETVEITTLTTGISIGGGSLIIQYFHYTSLGFSYFGACNPTQGCFTFHYSDVVNGKVFYPSNKTIENSMGDGMSSYVYGWHGFDVNVEEVEDKIIDLPTPDQ